MKNPSFFLLLILIVYSCENTSESPIHFPKQDSISLKVFPKNCSIRALEVLDANSVWYAGSNGQFGYTENGGETWQIDSIKIDSLKLEFRSIAITNQAVFLLSIASPALLLKSTDKGRNWQIVYREDQPAAFYDSMKFWDDKNGIAVGDPIDGCLSIIITKDGGENWTKTPCEQLPPSFEGEACFAASNTNIATFNDHAWIVSGGKKARVFKSKNRGSSWEVVETPIDQGGKMTGIFSVDFADEKNGIIFGGDWDDKSQNTKSKAITEDGGKSWTLVEGDPGFMSCVQYIPGTMGEGVIACSSNGISISEDGGSTWENLSAEGFYSLRCALEGNTIWLSGKDKIGLIKW